MAGICSVASESRKQAASRPRPPLPSPASGSCSSSCSQVEPSRCAATSLDERLEQQVDDVVGQRPADEELHRQVVDALGVLALVGAARSAPSAARGRRAPTGRPPRTARGLRPPSGRRRCRTAGGGRRARRPSPRTGSGRSRIVRAASRHSGRAGVLHDATFLGSQHDCRCLRSTGRHVACTITRRPCARGAPRRSVPSRGPSS